VLLDAQTIQAELKSSNRVNLNYRFTQNNNPTKIISRVYFNTNFSNLHFISGTESDVATQEREIIPTP
jgi:hypothetical protein